MACKCYACTIRASQLPVSWATSTDPLGCCKICHIHACGLHGIRIKSGPIFKCVLCEPKLLLDSAINQLKTKTDLIKYLNQLLGIFPKDFIYDSLKEFLEKNPDFAEWIKDVNNSKIDWSHPGFTPLFRDSFKETDIQVQQLLIAAGLIIRNLFVEIPNNIFSDELITISRSITISNTENNNDYELAST
ncbi:MAG TPA: hypothetical protein PKC72_07185 [Chitinophagaceae bacterium]|nr:hypothetical protein [Chitinophagaceae bacterium]